MSARRLERLLAKIDTEIEIVAKLKSVKGTVAWLQKNQVDLIFLDIHLSDGEAFNIFDQIEVRTPIIFTTAYDTYILRAFRQNSIDYILKPIDEKQLQQSIDKFKNLYLRTNYMAVNYEQIKQLLQVQQPTYKKRFLIQVGVKLKIVKVDYIAYCFSQDKTTFLVTHDSKSYPIDQSLNQLELALNPTEFFRVNRQFLIHSQAIQEMHYSSKSRIKIELEPPANASVFVSIEKVGQFKRWLDV